MSESSEADGKIIKEYAMALKYAVLGAGAMGIRFGVTLRDDLGLEVDFIDIYQPFLDFVAENKGVYISRDGENERFVPLQVESPESYQGQPDVWIIFAKQMQLESLLQRSTHLFHPERQHVLTGMNGMGHIEKINQYFPAEKVMAGTCLIGTVIPKLGHIDFIGKKGSEAMQVAAQLGYADKVQLAIVDDLQEAQFHPTLSDNFLGMLWGKLIFNSVVNTICTLFEIRMGQFIAYEGAETLAKQLIHEAYDVAERAGVTLSLTREQEWESVYHVSSIAAPLHYPSMYQDLTQGRPTEVDYINGYIYEIGRQFGYQASTHDFIRHLVHLAENNRSFK